MTYTPTRNALARVPDIIPAGQNTCGGEVTVNNRDPGCALSGILMRRTRSSAM